MWAMFDAQAMSRALDARRTDRGLTWTGAARDLTWSALARELGCESSRLTGLRTARYATAMTLAMAITQWLERPAADFVYPARW